MQRLWPYQEPLKTYRVKGKGISTGKTRQRTYEARSLAHLEEVAKEDETLVESAEEVEPRQPTSNQLNYAKDLGIKDIPGGISYYELSNMINDAIKNDIICAGRSAGLDIAKDISYEEAKDLEELIFSVWDDQQQIKWRHGSIPTQKETEMAKAVAAEIKVTKFTSAASLHERVWEVLDANQDKTGLASWYLLNVYLDVLGAEWSELISPSDLRLARLAHEFLHDKKAEKSLLGSPPYLRFRESMGVFKRYASRGTIAYEKAIQLLSKEFLEVGKVAPRKKTQDRQAKAGCENKIQASYGSDGKKSQILNLEMEGGQSSKPFAKTPLAYVLAVVFGAIAAPIGLIASPLALCLSNLKGEHTNNKGQKITPLSMWIAAGVVFTPVCWILNQTMPSTPSPPKETKAERLRIDFCRSILDTVKPDDPLCGKYLSRLQKEGNASPQRQ